jgi:hypothetical protein
MDKVINTYLKRWGTNPHGEPNVRLVWSNDARELRRGEFNEFYGDILLRTVEGVREVPKYSYIFERWVLERWFSPDSTASLELPVSQYKGSHEPIYVFQDKWGNPLPLSLKVVELICSAMFNQPPTKQQIHDSIRDTLEGKDRAEQAYFEDALEISTPIQSALSTGHGLGYGSHKGGR